MDNARLHRFYGNYGISVTVSMASFLSQFLNSRSLGQADFCFFISILHVSVSALNKALISCGNARSHHEKWLLDIFWAVQRFICDFGFGSVFVFSVPDCYELCGILCQYPWEQEAVVFPALSKGCLAVSSQSVTKHAGLNLLLVCMGKAWLSVVENLVVSL